MKFLKFIILMLQHLFRRGRGIFKLLFVVDDFFRVFTMTILIPVLFNWLNLGKLFFVLGVLLGFVIDMHDFIAEAGIAKLR